MAGGDHLGAGQAHRRCHPIEAQAQQVGQEQEQAAAAGREASAGERQRARIGDRLDAGARGVRRRGGAGRGCEAELTQHLAHRGGAQRGAARLERLGDLVDRVVALAQLLDAGAGGGLLGLALRAARCGEEELGLGVAAEPVAGHPEGACAVAELCGHLSGAAPIEEVAAQRLVLALLGMPGLAEEAPAFC